MKRIDRFTLMITGAGGFLGSELIDQLYTSSDYNIIALTSKKEAILEMYDNRDRLNCYGIEKLNDQSIPWSTIDVIIHTAFARSYDGKSLAGALKFTNDLLFNAKKNGVRSFVNISSQSIYGDISQPLWNENTLVSPDSTYAIAKYASEIITNNVCEDSNMKGTSIRLSSLLGPGLDSRLVSKFVKQAIQNELIKIVGGGQILSFLDVRDAAAGLIALISTDYKSWNNTYNLGAFNRYTIVEIAEIVKEVALKYFLIPVNIEIEDKNVDFDSGMDSGLFYKDTGWKPKYDMQAIVESLFDYFLNQQI
ncbi:MAG: SDR family oxidoreductase [Tissierellia bacterium]|nr:SDR family oxidoreductase [Tissierellia bacterium]